MKKLTEKINLVDTNKEDNLNTSWIITVQIKQISFSRRHKYNQYF